MTLQLQGAVARRFFQAVTRRSRVAVAARYRCLAQPAASQHPGDGLKPSLEIAPPGATPIHSGCPLGERPYGSEDAQKGVSPQAPSSRAVTGVLQTGNPGWKSVMSINSRCPLMAQCHLGLCEKSHRSPLAISHRHGFNQPGRSN